LRQVRRRAAQTILLVAIFLGRSQLAAGQVVPYARSFAKRQADVEQALKDLQAYSGQKLPILDGFVAAGAKPLDWTSVTLAERAFTTEDTEETCGLKKEDVESRSCRCASGKRGGLPQKAVHENHGTDLKSLCEDCGKLPSAAKAALNFRELRHS
jgi:hypothetical protein